MLKEIFKLVKNNKIKTWDYQLAFINLFHNGLAINPNINLITNIGFGANATHAVNTNDTPADVARA